MTGFFPTIPGYENFDLFKSLINDSLGSSNYKYDNFQGPEKSQMEDS